MTRHWLTCSVIVTLSAMLGSMVLAQRPPGGVKLTKDFKGVFRQFTKDGLIEMESAGKVVFVKVEKGDKNAIEATAEPSFLAPAMYIKFECLANANGEVKDPLTKITVLEQTEIESPAFSIDDPTAVPSTKKPTKEEMEVFKKYFVRGPIRKVTGDELTIQAQTTLVKAKIAPEAKIDVQLNRYNLAVPGDEVWVKQGDEYTAPAAGPQAPTKPKLGTGKTKGPPPVDLSQARWVITDWVIVTAKTPLVGKKKPGAK